MERIYLDHAATTPMHPRVIEKMIKTMTDHFGNPSSIHSYGREARKLVDEARIGIAQSIGAKETEIIFTSGGTEADNYAIFGVAEANSEKGKHIITTDIEHHAVLQRANNWKKEALKSPIYLLMKQVRFLLKISSSALRDDTILVTIMYGNNEVGTIQPIAQIGELLDDHQAIFHTDAVQAYGIENINVNELKVDLLSRFCP